MADGIQSTWGSTWKAREPGYDPVIARARKDSHISLADNPAKDRLDERITMVIPDVPGGVMDYAHMMAGHMGNARVLVYHKDLNVDGDSVLLHMSGYGYSRYGAPLHLLNWARRNKPRMKRFGVFMHEAYAVSDRITSSVYWVWRAQRYIASQLARRSDFWISNTHYIHDWLETQAGDLPHLWMPIYSTIGELAELPAVRQKKLVVFGTALMRVNTWRAGGEALFRWAAASGLEIHDIGSPIGDPEIAAMLKARGVIAHGRLPAEAVQKLLTAATYGVVAYSPHDVAKSGIFGAYSAHGVVPVLLSPNTGSHDGLAPGVQYLEGIPLAEPDPVEMARMSRAAFDWYQGHSVAASCDAIEALFGPAHGAEGIVRSGTRPARTQGEQGKVPVRVPLELALSDGRGHPFEGIRRSFGARTWGSGAISNHGFPRHWPLEASEHGGL
ncbi:hypothetical protein [Variovorax rhizosphaerae]|uniref:Uncharacterized protein n=1 Tax=Variovorax rhizosphaerae TaxID=1836200 RepID=A0ABU8WD11_9BURK